MSNKPVFDISTRLPPARRVCLDFIRWHFHSALSIRSLLSLSSLFSPRLNACFDLQVVWSLPSHSICLCRSRFVSSRWRYHCVAPLETLVFRRREENPFIRCGASPIKLASWKSTTNRRWSPTPKPAGITHAWVTAMSGIAHTPLIGFEPQKNVGPILLPINSPTTSNIFNPSVLVNDFPRDFR